MIRTAFIDQTGASAGGAQESFSLLLRYLPPSIDARVVLFHDGAYAARLREAGERVSIFPVAPQIDGLRRERVGAGAALTAWASIFRLSRWLREQRIDVVYTHTVKAHFLGAPAARLAGIPCVMHLRDLLEGRALSALRFVSASCSRERIAISRSVAGAYGLSRTTVVHNPVSVDGFRNLPAREHACAALGIPFEPDVPVIGIVGRINRWKGHDRFLHIAAQVATQAKARFVIIGSPIFRDADFLPELQDLTARLHLDDRVHFIPWVHDVRDAYAALDVHCNCSSREPFGRTVIEAAAAGVPSVCFADAGAAEVLTDDVDGKVVASGNQDAFARAILDLLTTAEKLAGMKLAARTLALRFDPVRHAEAVTAVLGRAAA